MKPSSTLVKIPGVKDKFSLSLKACWSYLLLSNPSHLLTFPVILPPHSRHQVHYQSLEACKGFPTSSPDSNC